MFNISLLNDCALINELSSLKSEGFCKVSTDTRTYSEGEVFFALTGPTFDGFDFVEKILTDKTPAVVFKESENNLSKAKDLISKFPNTAFYSTVEPILALQELSNLHMKDWKKYGNKKLIGITGSNGKTTNKEMLFHLLNSVFSNKVLCTKGNLNNHIGVPLTLLSIEKDHDIAIVEMGTNHHGEIAELCKIAEPEAGIITNIGLAHIEFLGDQEGVFKEKSALYRSVVEKTNGLGVFVVNANDSFLNKLEDSKGLIKLGQGYDWSYEFDRTSGFILKNKNEEIRIENDNIREEYNLINLAVTLTLSLNLYPNKKEVLIEASKEFMMPKLNRSEWIEKNGYRIFLDAYNANPTSMEAAVRSYLKIIKKEDISMNEVLMVLGDMNELGDAAEEQHVRLARILKEEGVIDPVFVGRYSDHYKSGFESECKTYIDKKELVENWLSLIQNKTDLFIKASRSLQLESLIDIKKD